MNTLNGYSKSTLTDKYVLTAAGGHLAVGNAANNIPLNNSTVNTNLNADTVDNWHRDYFQIGYDGSRHYRVLFALGAEDLNWKTVVKVNSSYTAAPTSRAWQAATVRGYIWYSTNNYSGGELRKYPFCAVFKYVSGTSLLNTASLYLPLFAKEYDCIRIVRISTNSFELQLKQIASWQVGWVEYQISGEGTKNAYTSLQTAGSGTVVVSAADSTTLTEDKASYAYTSGTATNATNITVTLHTSNDTEYPLVWSNETNTNNKTSNLLYKSYSDLIYNPKNKRLTVKGSVKTNVLTISSTSLEKHLTFSRGGYNYISAPSGGIIGFMVNGKADCNSANCELVIQDGNLNPGTTNVTALGTTELRWSNVYAVAGNFLSHVESTSTTENAIKHAVTNSNGSVELLVSLNRGLYDRTNNKWIIYVPNGTTNVLVPTWASKGSSTLPIYFNSSGEPVACTSYANYVKWTAADASLGIIGKLTLGSTTNTLYDLFITSNGTVIADSTDLNTIKTPGIRYSGSSTNSATMTNVPWTSSGFRLITLTGYGSSSNYGILLAHGSQHFFWRTMGSSNGSPSSWFSWIRFKYGTAVGNSTTPIYLSSEGVPTACTAYSGLLTALSSSSTTNLSITVGGTTKTVTNTYATYHTHLATPTDDTFSTYTSTYAKGLTVFTTNSSDIGDIPAYSTVLTVGSGVNRSYRLMGIKGGHLFYLSANGTEWATKRLILDSVNYTSYLGYIGTTAVQSSSKILSVSGLGNTTPGTTNTYTLGSSSLLWKDLYTMAGYINTTLSTNLPTYSNSPLKFGNSSNANDTTNSRYRPWFAGLDSVKSYGYGVTVSSGIYRDPGYSSGGYYIGIGWDGNANSSLFKFDRDGDLSMPGKLLVGNSTSIKDQRFSYGLTYYNSTTATVTGTIVITFPNGWNSSMNTYEIDIYEYNNYDEDAANILHSKLIISGYNYSADAKWINYGYKQIGSYNKGVRLGYNGSKCCILLGTTSTTWSYPLVHLSRVITGYGNLTTWSTGYSISVITSESGYSKIVTASRTRQYFADVVANNFRGNLKGTADRLALNGITNDTAYGTYAGIIQNAYSGPESKAWHNSIKILHNNSAGYYTQLAQNFTGSHGLWHRSNRDGTISRWYKVIDDLGGTIYGDLSLQSDEGNSPKLRFIRGGSVGDSSALWDWLMYISSGHFYLQADLGNGSWTTPFFINTGLNVGIGTDNPSHKLHVNGNIFLNNLLYFADSKASVIKYGQHTTTALGSYPLPSLGSNGLGLYVRPSKNTDEGGIIITEDSCMIFNSGDAGWNFQVHNTDLKQKDFSGTDGKGELSRTFGVTENTHYAWSRGGFLKNGSSDSYVLLGGGSHKALSDFSMSHSHPYSSGGNTSYSANVSAAGWVRIASTSSYNAFGIISMCHSYSNNATTGVSFIFNTGYLTNSGPSITLIGGTAGLFTKARIVRATTSANVSTAYIEVYYNSAKVNTLYINITNARHTTLLTSYTAGAIPTNYTSYEFAFCADGISANTMKFGALYAPTTSGGTTFGPGTSGQVLKSNGTTVYWASDNNSTYAVYGKTIDASYKTAYRTQTGRASGYYLAAIRCDTASVDEAPLYGTGMAFGMADTHGYLYMSYSSANAYIGAGNADKLNWTATLLHSGNYTTYTDSRYVNVSGDTMTGDLKFGTAPTTTGSTAAANTRLPSHIYRNVYDTSGNVYDHYYNTEYTASTNSYANLRVKSGSTFKTFSFGGDGRFTWDGNRVWHAGNDGSGSGLDADTVDGLHVSKAGNTKPWGTIVSIGTDGVSEMGRCIDFHYDNTTGSDYSTRLLCSSTNNIYLNLPSVSGTLALKHELDGYVKKSGDWMSGTLNFGDNIGLFGQMAGGTDHWEIKGDGTSDNGRLKIQVHDNATTDAMDFEFVDWGGDVYRPLTMTGLGAEIIAKPTPGSWISGKTEASIKYQNLTAIDSSSFWKFYSMKSQSGNVVCYGGLGNTIGFYGYYAATTANRTDWNFTVNTANGNWTASASLYAAHFYENSDEQLKTNIQEILNSDKMPIIKEFDWKEDNSHSYGLIAQELEELGYSELVSVKDDGYKTVNYSAALSLIVGKLQVKIRELEKEIENLKNKN